MAVLLCSADTAAGQASLIVKSGPSAYGTPRAVPTGRGPLLVVQCPGGRLYVAVSVSDEVLVLDPDGAGRGRVRVGWAPGAIAVSPDGRSAVVCERGAGSAAVLDLSALVGTGGVQVADRVVLGSAHVQPRAVALWGNRAVFACARLDGLPVLDLAGGRVEEWVWLPVAGAAPAGIAVTAEGGYALVTLERAGVLAVVDLLEWTVTRLVPLGAGPRGVVVDPVDATVYCALAGQGALAVVHLDGVDLSNVDGTPQFEEIPVGVGPSSVALVHVDDPVPAR